jgi:uncharacterized protein
VGFQLEPGGPADEFLSPARLDGPLAARFFVEWVGPGVRVKGTIEGRLVMVCQRCLKEAIRPVEMAVDTLLSPSPQEFPDEVQLGRGDLEVEYFEDLIDLDQLALEQVELNLPMVYVCREDCPGLCPGCGADLGREACRCGQAPGDPRWEKLKDWRP